MFVIPAEGRNVRDPITKKHLPETGKEVPQTTYWERRIASGDVLVLEAQMIPDSFKTEEVEP